MSEQETKMATEKRQDCEAEVVKSEDRLADAVVAEREAKKKAAEASNSVQEEQEKLKLMVDERIEKAVKTITDTIEHYDEKIKVQSTFVDQLRDRILTLENSAHLRNSADGVAASRESILRDRIAAAKARIELAKNN